MVKKYSPLISNSTWGDHWISEDIKCDFATEMVRNLKINKLNDWTSQGNQANLYQAVLYFSWSISLCSFLENFLKLI